MSAAHRRDDIYEAKPSATVVVHHKVCLRNFEKALWRCYTTQQMKIKKEKKRGRCQWTSLRKSITPGEPSIVDGPLHVRDQKLLGDIGDIALLLEALMGRLQVGAAIVVTLE